MKPKFCTECGGGLPPSAKFCPGCGVNLRDGVVALAPRRTLSNRLAPLTGKNLLIVAVLSVVVLAIGWNVNAGIAGTKPTVTFEEMRARNDPLLTDPTLKRLREAAEATDDKYTWKALGEALLGKLHTTDEPSQQLIFETIEVLKKVLEIDGQDGFALANMADISLNQQVFEKAVEYYSRYLQVSPKDHLARARYASALSFLGKPDEGIKELTVVLKAEPHNFHALAYLAVTYAQTGKKALALETGEKALAHAPSDEARARFRSFLQAVKEDRLGQEGAAPRQGEAISGQATPGSVAAVEAFIRKNKVAGPKFERGALVDQMVTLSFREFPMDKMPPFVRDKFTGEVVAEVRKSLPEVSLVVFLDADSGAELVRVETGAAGTVTQ